MSFRELKDKKGRVDSPVRYTHRQCGFFAVSPVSAIRDRSEVERQVWTKLPVFYAILAVTL